jgi:hypothetical protein
MADQAGNSGSVDRQYPPRMTRSQPQLATAYAPGAMFTWEGGKGACIAVPVEGTPIDFSARQTRRDQMVETLVEFCRNWLARGMAINRTPPVFEIQLLDTCFYNPMRKGVAGVDIALDRFEFLRPERMGYLPGPLVYRCDHCEIVREYISPAHQLAEPLPALCPGNAKGENRGGECRWRQLDVVYVHWSGELEGLSPYRNTVNADGIVQKIPRCQCGATDFRLFKQGNQFSRWRFKCTGCSTEKEVYQSDKFTLPLLKPLIEQNSGHQWGEINMLPVSYRASQVFYVQTARFIVFDTDPEVVALMMPGREADLAGRIATLHGFGGAEPTPERIKQQLEARGAGPLWLPYEMMLKQAADAAQPNPALAKSLSDAARAMLDGWYATGHVVREAEASPALAERVNERARLYARKFDPIRSTIEHDALRQRKLSRNGEAADLRIAHAGLCAEYDDADLRRVYAARVGDDLGRAGIKDAFLIQKLDMVEFSFGFTRVSATPETTQHDERMPVRLKGFPPLASGKRPIYVIEQQNEAIYIQLEPATVAQFLAANGVMPSPPLAPRTLGSAMIETYQDFGVFLKDFSVRDEASRIRQRDIGSMTYLLLHTFAHHVMHSIARFSGLDLGSLSEVIFPADQAFLVHRRGMTEDLGNISSMWRDQNAAFLRYLVSRRELRCGSGTLCDHRGGACPACIMVPETSCIAGNQLLSRAALVGGRAPLWDQNQARLCGYFDLVAEGRRAVQIPTDA